MNKLQIRIGYLFLAFCFLSCTSSIELEDFSAEDWKSDRNGCLGKRGPMLESVMTQKEQILGKAEHDVLKVMGRPDKNELYRRQQKFYIYYLEPGPLCEVSLQASDSASYLSLRFNATGIVNEIFVFE
jgi:hypothetical protein